MLRITRSRFGMRIRLPLGRTNTPLVAVWVKEQTQPGTIGPFHSWTHWASHPGHDNSPWVEDERLPPLRDRLCAAATTSRGILRLVGLAGIGKSRLALEALVPPDDNLSLSDMVLYADESVGRHKRHPSM